MHKDPDSMLHYCHMTADCGVVRTEFKSHLNDSRRMIVPAATSSPTVLGQPTDAPQDGDCGQTVHAANSALMKSNYIRPLKLARWINEFASDAEVQPSFLLKISRSWMLFVQTKSLPKIFCSEVTASPMECENLQAMPRKFGHVCAAPVGTNYLFGLKIFHVHAAPAVLDPATWAIPYR